VLLGLILSMFLPSLWTSVRRLHGTTLGIVYFVTPNLQLDMRAGVGLNEHSNDFLAGLGFAARY